MWDNHEIFGNLAVGAQVHYVLTLETVKAKSCRVGENTFMNTGHEAVFLETDISKEGKINKTYIKNWKPSHHSVGEKGEDLKIDLEKLAKQDEKESHNSRRKRRRLMLSKKRHDPARHAEDKQNTETNVTKKLGRNRIVRQLRQRKNTSGENEDF